jgi:hypothetical protein
MMRVIAMLTLLLLPIVIVGCGGASGEPDEAVALVTYIDRDSGETVEAPAQPTPAVNPKTGAASLLRAGWCAECQKWYPLPPDRNPGQVVCRKHQTPLSLTGPVHDTPKELSE